MSIKPYFEIQFYNFSYHLSFMQFFTQHFINNFMIKFIPSAARYSFVTISISLFTFRLCFIFTTKSLKAFSATHIISNTVEEQNFNLPRDINVVNAFRLVNLFLNNYESNFHQQAFLHNLCSCILLLYF